MNTAIFEIRDGVFALGIPGKKAQAICSWSKKKNKYQGVRGRRPTIPADQKRAAGVSAAVKEALEALAN